MTKNSAGPGNVTMVEIKTTEAEGSEITEICTAFGQLGVSAEAVGSQAAHEAREYLVSRAAAGGNISPINCCSPSRWRQADPLQR